MPSYWWQCGNCQAVRTFEQEVGTGVVTWLWDVLARSDWSQELLVRDCLRCGGAGTNRITYHFPRAAQETISVANIAGFQEGTCLSMAWITYPHSDPAARWCHFNYMEGRSNWGLNKPAVLTQDEMRKMIALLESRAGFVICARS